MPFYVKSLFIAIPSFIVLIILEIIVSKLKGIKVNTHADMISSLSSGMTNTIKDALKFSIAIISYSYIVEVVVAKTNYILEPILGIRDARYDKRINFLAGFKGLESIEKKVDNGEAKIGFSLFPTQIEDVINFADKKLTMPPKSTWFDPKPLDGLVSYDLNENEYR